MAVMKERDMYSVRQHLLIRQQGKQGCRHSTAPRNALRLTGPTAVRELDVRRDCHYIDMPATSG
jgi:hypothetical protein